MPLSRLPALKVNNNANEATQRITWRKAIAKNHYFTQKTTHNFKNEENQIYFASLC